MSETKVADSAKKTQKARLRAIELKKAEVELASLKVDQEIDEIRLAGYRDDRKKKVNEDESTGVFSLETSVGSTSVTLATKMRNWARLNPEKPIILNIFSPGGSILHGLVLYDTLRTLSLQGHVVTTVARGYAASMGSIVFLAGDVRLIGAEAFVMFHAMSAGGGGSLHELEDDLKFYKRLQARLDGIITSRTKVTKKLLTENTKKQDWWIESSEALALKVATDLG